MELTMIINAASKLRISDEELYHRFVTHIQSRMGKEAFHVRDISVIVTALARVNCVDANTMSRFADCAVQTLPQATPLELARLMYACMSVSCHAHDLFTACVLQNREQASSMDPTGLSNAAYAFGQCFEVAEVSHLRYLQKIFRHIRLASIASLPLFLPREIVGLLKTYARWQITFDCGQLCKVAERMLATKKHFDLDTTVNGLHCLALLMQRNAIRSGAETTGSSKAAWEAVARAAGTLLIPELSSLQAWMLEQGAPSSGIRFVDLPGFKYSLVAETDLKAGDTLLRVPSSLHISPSYVRSTELGKTFSSIDDSALLALGLMAEAAKGEEGKWWPYIRMLPSSDELHIPLLWPEDERKQLLKGSPLDVATEQQLLQLTEQWNDIAAVIKELGLDSQSWTKEKWLWAHAIVLTRALPFGNELSLIPGLDLANHELGSKNTCSIGVAAADGQVVEATDAK
ncbi:unnamed protein product [Cladocopium goreaui]|uniref:Actin-histidine N-methyltransferase (Protein-L-histidine N-tele-methyltransferase) (SET domain-containing protein 3) n=1 Tax=Cladocopium goreaui TaxID=2562237 RepID=A0A9P1FI37_9DINO|nr:unnamed protein product [Cladocopium goreaui]